MSLLAASWALLGGIFAQKSNQQLQIKVGSCSLMFVAQKRSMGSCACSACAENFVLGEAPSPWRLATCLVLAPWTVASFACYHSWRLKRVNVDPASWCGQREVRPYLLRAIPSTQTRLACLSSDASPSTVSFQSHESCLRRFLLLDAFFQRRLFVASLFEKDGKKARRCLQV